MSRNWTKQQIKWKRENAKLETELNFRHSFDNKLTNCIEQVVSIVIILFCILKYQNKNKSIRL